MLFNSLTYAIFLPIVFAVYWTLPHKWRWTALLIASYYFYMSWNPKYVVLILGTTGISYLAGLLLEKADTTREKRIIVAITAILCLSVLFVFKYFNFMSESLSQLLSLFAIEMHPVTLNLLLPVGISFYTFQTMSYVIDVYRGEVEAEKHFGYYATFISFFPQLVAGPIERTRNLLPQIKDKHVFDYDNAMEGVVLMAWGFYKKMVIADTLAPYVDKVYADLGAYSGFALVIAAFFFTLQIYCDFSGYSDIAIGSAKLMGINLMANFKTPYFSTSIKEFWQRWHISLSTWFRDYVYIPLGGNRCSNLRRDFNLLITFLVSGLWHGANWTFVLWGGAHGLAQVAENRLSIKKNDSIVRKIGQWIVVFMFCNLAWVLFRSETLGEAVYVYTHLFDGMTSPMQYLFAEDVLRVFDYTEFAILYVAMIILIFLLVEIISHNRYLPEVLREQKEIVRNAICVIFMVILILFSEKGVAAEFVYFQF